MLVVALWFGSPADRVSTEQPPRPRSVAKVDTTLQLQPALGAALRRADRWLDGLAWAHAVELNRQRAERRRQAVIAASIHQPAVAYEPSSGRCGGSLPPCSVMACESGGNLRAENPRSSASGKWQITDGTWGGYGGYSHASDAPESVQDERARQVYAGGAGRSQWSC